MSQAADRERAAEMARWLLSEGAVFLDTETTGLDSRDQICEIALVAADGVVLVDTLVRPSIRIPPSATAIHGISDADVAAAPRFEEVWPEVRRKLDDRHLIIYNAEYDTRMMFQTARPASRAEWSLPARSVACAMKLYAQYHGAWNGARRSYAWQSLGNAIIQCAISLPAEIRLHRARADAETTRLLLMHMAGQRV
ncbi:MAG: 3'-5' exonuclease [Acidobacteria bacterium]|nr:3'-5' exonuclease [Acidobacteriota bacterium]